MTSDRYSEQLVLRVNELFHDLTDGYYSDVHREILGAEGERWRRVAQRFLPPSPRRIADVGTGMGMVPIAIGSLLNADDHLIAADISQRQLDEARANIEREGYPWSVEYVKLEPTLPFTLPFADASLDMLTMNSVLHHIKETEAFLQEVDRVLKPGGLYFVAHEPNAAYTENRASWYAARLLYGLTTPSFAFRSRPARMLGIYSIAMAMYRWLRPEAAGKSQAMVDTVNEIVMREGLSPRRLSQGELGEITDILDNTGFHPRELLPHYDVLHLETYNHLGQLSIDRAGGGIISRLDAWLGRRRPEGGATFFLALRKPVAAQS